MEPEHIGTAHMDASGNITLDLRAEHESGALGLARFVYSPSHPEYDNVLRHLGGLVPGEQKLVPPWPDKTP